MICMVNLEENIMETVYPVYSDQLVALARCYDRAVLANAAVGWCLSNKLDIDEDDYFTNWVQLRQNLLCESLPDLHILLCDQIIQESKPFFRVEYEDTPYLIKIPTYVRDLLQPYRESEFLEGHDTSEYVAQALQYKDHQVILFDDEVYLLPKAMPKSFIEVWWRRSLFQGNNEVYALCLVPNEKYGWDCHGQEI